MEVEVGVEAEAGGGGGGDVPLRGTKWKWRVEYPQKRRNKSSSWISRKRISDKLQVVTWRAEGQPFKWREVVARNETSKIPKKTEQ